MNDIMKDTEMLIKEDKVMIVISEHKKQFKMAQLKEEQVNKDENRKIIIGAFANDTYVGQLISLVRSNDKNLNSQ